ncbi:MAG: hypothetical protein PWQ12_1670 [Clostridiales bacterium]|jgi:hypothetical protein|nr:hypothetical protein [Clostridiales bacterium]
MTENEKTIVNRFLDDQGRVKTWPSKNSKQTLIFAYIAEFFEVGVKYTEHDINMKLSELHTFEDLFLLRRGLIVSGYMDREKDGSAYWRTEQGC